MPDLIESMPAGVREKFRRAIAQETFERNAAFLGLTESVGPYPVRPLRWRDYLTLQTIRSPLMGKGTPSTVELIGFLWLLNPAYPSAKGRKQFLRSCRPMVEPPRPRLKCNLARWHDRCANALVARARVLIAARTYIESTFADSPSGKGDGFTMHYYSEMVAVCAAFARQYGWAWEDVMNMPVKIGLQFLKEMRGQGGRPLFNPSTRILDEYLNDLNRANAAN